jgi:hypothetical protein
MESEYEFRTIPIWTRVYGIPMGAMNKETGDLIGDRIGKTLDVDLDDSGDAMGEYMRIKVRIDITSPITRFIELIIDDDEENDQGMLSEGMLEADDDENRKKKEEREVKTITFKYEYLPDFCYNCGIIGHIEKACPTRTRREGERHFGPWLKATIYRGSSSEEKSRGSSERDAFWKTNSAGSKHDSDGPSWRKSLLDRPEDNTSKKSEEKEITSPLKITQGEQIGSGGGKKLNFGERQQMLDTKNNEGETLHRINTMALKDSNSAKQSNEVNKQMTRVGFQKEIEENRAKQKEDSQGSGEKGEAPKIKTFKRLDRPKVKPQQEWQHNEAETKKRNADSMDVEADMGAAKKAKMEVDGEEEKEESTEAVVINAGLHGQPGGSK